MKTILKIVVGVIVAVVILAVGLIALIGGAANEVAKDIESEDAEHEMTTAEFNEVKPGVKYDAFIEEYGVPNPEQTQRIEAKGMKTVTIYYNVEGGEFLDTFQFSFTNKTLESKSKF